MYVHSTGLNFFPHQGAWQRELLLLSQDQRESSSRHLLFQSVISSPRDERTTPHVERSTWRRR
uniref:Uncharacterized protein n=1 Tax=Arundo donax TaxID=35708 RepID=A0A0A9GC05_ARUDO